ncbi:MAG: hypothetical protein JXA22_04405 [Candidatus Thermoplasmatota archaeon]|nr:hypothetical protein [Candidatus Thermoplasmatota archaeon]
MDGILEFTADIRKEGSKYRATCPEIGLSLTSSDYLEALEYLRKWTKAVVEPYIPKDMKNS